MIKDGLDINLNKYLGGPSIASKELLFVTFNKFTHTFTF